MLLDFTYDNPTKIHFGKEALSNLANELSAYGKTVLLVYGMSAIKKNGLYDEVTAILKKAEKEVVELSGVQRQL